MRYLLNSAVITGPGRYSYKTISPEIARKWLESGEYRSTIGYAETCSALATILDIPEPPVNREMVRMKPGDQALVFRLTVRLSDPTIKGKLNNPAWIAGNCEFGLLWLSPGPAELCEICRERPCPPGTSSACQGSNKTFIEF